MSQRYFEGAQHAAVYAKFRPCPPKELGDRIINYLKEKYHGNLSLCIDVGCGNGQSSNLFSSNFRKVIATDVSAAQVNVAKAKNHPSNIEFLISSAEQMPTDDGSVQIVNASQACHWFDLPKFYKETQRVLCPNGIVALSGYTFPKFVHPNRAHDLQAAFDLLYQERTGPYWGSGRELVDNEYSDIVIPLGDFTREEFWTNETKISISEFIGYITTWSGFQNYCKTNGEEAGQKILTEFTSNVLKVLGDQNDEVELKIRRKYFLLMGRKH